MTTLTTNTPIHAPAQKVKAPLTLETVIATLFALKLRESLDAATGGDKSDAAWTWGM
jgi:hypothetical protein